MVIEGQGLIGTIMNQEDEIVRLTAETARLRAALEKVVRTWEQRAPGTSGIIAAVATIVTDAEDALLVGNDA